ncbi:MAG: FecR family protein [Candidatus Absconditabacteria bacterium]
MRSKIIVFIVFMLVLIPIQKYCFAQEDNYAWVFLHTTKFDGQDQVDNIESRDKTDQIELSSNYQYGNGWIDYSVSSNFYGYKDSVKALISDGWKTISPDKPISLKMTLNIIDSGSDRAGGVVQAYFCSPQSGLMDGGEPDFADDNGNTRFESNSFNGFPSYDVIVKASIGPGQPGDKIAICTRASLAGINMGTNYIYEWKNLNEKTEATDGINNIYKAPKDKNGEYLDSGVRVSDVSGEVLVRRGDDRLGWEMVEPGMVIYQGDVIHTVSRDGECLLSLPDLTTFQMKPTSVLVIDLYSEKESKLKLLAGKVIANVKKMIKDGSMNVEMSQAVAGIKGTIFVLKEDQNSSSIEVIEGTVEFKSKVDNQAIMVSAGEILTATSSGLGEKTNIDSDKAEESIKQENSQDKNVQTKQVTKPQETKNNTLIYILPMLILFSILGYIYYKKSKNSK